jgi:hypothetical protein
MQNQEDTKRSIGKKYPVEEFKIAVFILLLLLMILFGVSIIMVTSTNHSGVSMI